MWWKKRRSPASQAPASDVPERKASVPTTPADDDEPSPPSINHSSLSASASVGSRIPLLIGNLEMGMCDDAIVKQIFAELESAPEQLLPALMPRLAQTGFLRWKTGRGEAAKRLLLTCLGWYLNNCKGASDDISSLTKNIQYVFEKTGRTLSEKETHELAKSGQPVRTATLPADALVLEDAQRVLEIADGQATQQRTRFAEGLRPAVPMNLPLTVFNGWLKRLDPSMLNAAGKHALNSIFPLFGEETPEQFLARNDHLAALGIKLSAEDIADISWMRKLMRERAPFKNRRHRRYAGGDGLLPRNCYASVCNESTGDDRGTLSRECMAYSDPRVPGTVYVGDSTNAKLNSIFFDAPQFRPGFCGIYVLLFAPDDSAQRQIWHAIYKDLLGNSEQETHMFVLETRVDSLTINKVIDLRLPDTQKWFFEYFKSGDGNFLAKEAGSVCDFFDLIPTLMHPRLGGSDVTHAVGSWMRNAGVDALVFPSARSDASVTLSEGKAVNWSGWNLLDYRTAKFLPVLEKTNSAGGWPDFLQPGAKLEVASRGQLAGSWRVTGVQSRYDSLQDQVEKLGVRQRDPMELAPGNIANNTDASPSIEPSS